MLQSQTAGVAPLDWYAAETSAGAPTDGVARTLVNDQSSSGYWWGNQYESAQQYFDTAWAIMMLHRTIVEAGRPRAVAKALPNPCVAGQVIELNGSDSFHQNAALIIDSWEWDLDNDGNFDVSGVKVNAMFDSIGNFPVRLRVTDNASPENSDETILTVRVNTPPLPPTADADGPYVFCPQAKPWFLTGWWSVNPDEGQHENGCPACPGDTIQKYEWDLNGDGHYERVLQVSAEVVASEPDDSECDVAKEKPYATV
jgi:hypothetical protein